MIEHYKHRGQAIRGHSWDRSKVKSETNKQTDRHTNKHTILRLRCLKPPVQIKHWIESTKICQIYAEDSVTKCGPLNFIGLKGTKREPLFCLKADLKCTYSIP